MTLNDEMARQRSEAAANGWRMRALAAEGEIQRLTADRNRLHGIVEAVRLSCRNVRRNASLDGVPEVEEVLQEIEAQLDDAAPGAMES